MAIANAINAQTAGMQSMTSAGVWNGRTITAGTGISVANGDGTGGNPTISATGSVPGLSTAYVFEDFLGQPNAGAIGGSIGNTSLNMFALGAGIAFIGPIEGTSTNPGIVQVNTGTNSSGAAVLFGGFATATTGAIALGGGTITCEYLVKIPTLSDGTQRFTCRAGFGNNWISAATAGNTPAQGCWFEYIDNVNSGAWTITNKGAGTTTANTANTADTDFHNLKIIINAAGTSVSFYYDGVEVSNSPIATNIPTQTISPFIQIVKSVGTTARDLYCDFFTFTVNLTSARPG